LNNAITGAAGISAFPWGILAINIIGSCLVGVLISVFAFQGEPSQEVKLFLTVGILGGFTTFSSFSLDAILLIQRGALAEAAFYILGSVIISLAALYAGMEATKHILS